jgi:hypothetical protein
LEGKNILFIPTLLHFFPFFPTLLITFSSGYLL